MADTKTTNYELIKEDAALPVRIAPINDNFDKIDTALKANADAIGDVGALLDAINGEVI